MTSVQSQFSASQGQEILRDPLFAADVLWFGGLGASLSSALLATLLQSWIRRYIVLTQVQQNPRYRAFIRAYVIREKSTKTLQVTIDFSHVLLDFATFSFLVAIVGLLPASAPGASLGVDPASSNFILTFTLFPLFAWYSLLVLMSFRRNTIYSTPLSRLVCLLGENIKLFLLSPISLLKSLMGRKSLAAFIRFDWVTLDNADQVALEVAGKITNALPSLDDEIVAWLINSLYHDKDLERFLESIPGFYRSDYVKKPAIIFRPFYEDQVPHAITSFMFRTLSSTTTSNEIKQKRIGLSLDVMELDPHLHMRIFSEHHLLSPTTSLECIDDLTSDPLVDKTDDEHPDTGNASRSPDVRLFANCIIAIAISRLTTQILDDHWFRVIKRRLKFRISTSALDDEHLANLKLVNLVRLVEDLRSARLKRRDKTVSQTLFIACSFRAGGAGHQYKVQFCNLWNQLQDSAEGDRGSNAGLILPIIQTIYRALHEDTNISLVNPSLTRCTTHVIHPKPPLTPGHSTGPERKPTGTPP